MIVQLLIDVDSANPGFSPAVPGSVALSATQADKEGENALQILVLEETAKLLGALSRKQWADLRSRSGTTASGRSRLGALVDPLGVFRSSNLVNVDDIDYKVLESTRAIVEALSRSSGGGGHDLGEGEGESARGLVSPALSASLRSLTPQEALQISSIIGEKVWSKRRELVRLSGRLAQIALKQARDRVA